MNCASLKTNIWPLNMVFPNLCVFFSVFGFHASQRRTWKSDHLVSHKFCSYVLTIPGWQMETTWNGLWRYPIVYRRIVFWALLSLSNLFKRYEKWKPWSYMTICWCISLYGRIRFWDQTPLYITKGRGHLGNPGHQHDHIVQIFGGS